jgi:hypothetical protein
MKPRDDLFLLIKRLSPTEKKALAMTPVRHDYQALFKALNELKEFEEKDFLASSVGRKFANNFSVRKNELYEKILQSIRVQRKNAGAAKAIEIQLREQLEDVLFLREKKLFDQCDRRLTRAKKSAHDHQLHEILLEILRIERSILLKTQAAGYSQELVRIHEEIEKITEIIKNKTKMLYLYDRYFLEVRQHRNLRGQVNYTLLDQLSQTPDLSDVSNCLSFEAESNFYFCHAIHNHLRGNPQGAWDFARTLYLRWQEQKGIQKVKAVEYRNVLQNYLSLCNSASLYDDFEIALKQLLAGPFFSDEEQASAIDNACHVSMQRCLNLCDWEGAKKSIQTFKEKLSQISDRLIPSRIMVHYLSFSRLFIVLEDWKSATNWAKKVIAEEQGEESFALVLQARMQEIIALFEIHNVDDLPNKCRAALRAIKKASDDRLTETFVIQAINRLTGNTNSEEVRDAFAAVLETVRNDQSEKFNQGEFVLTWLKAKAKGMRLRDYLEAQKK